MSVTCVTGQDGPGCSAIVIATGCTGYTIVGLCSHPEDGLGSLEASKPRFPLHLHSLTHSLTHSIAVKMASVADTELNHHSLTLYRTFLRTFSSFHRLGMTFAVAEALNPNKPNQTFLRLEPEVILDFLKAVVLYRLL